MMTQQQPQPQHEQSQLQTDDDISVNDSSYSRSTGSTTGSAVNATATTLSSLSIHPSTEILEQSSSPKTVKIGIIGAGPAGLVAARIMSRTIQQLQRGEHRPVPQFQITILEKTSDIGGVWKYQPDVIPQNGSDHRPSQKRHPMYRHLRTNLPKEIMAYREYPWKIITPSFTTPTSHAESRTDTENCDGATNSNISYVPHHYVYEYLNNYCRQYQLHSMIQYHCSVRQLTFLPTKTNDTHAITSTSYFSPTPTAGEDNENDEIWPLLQLTWDEMDGATFQDQPQQKSDVFDAVFVCNGHYNVPSYPNIPGLQQYFKGTVIHSVEYDIPDPFVNQTILCIGGRASGADIAREIANHHDGEYTSTTKVYLSDTAFPKSSSTNDTITQNNVTWVPKTLSILPDGRVEFDSSLIEPINADTIILCTGYDYDFPFINDASNMKDFIGCDQRRVHLLYEQLWYVSAPNIAFVGIPHSIIPFPLFEFQCEAVVQSWFRSSLGTPTRIVSTSTSDITTNTTKSRTLPSKKVRHEQAMIDSISGGYGKEKGRIPEDTHYLGPYQWDYCRTMAQYANIYNDEIESYIATNKVRTIQILLNRFEKWTLVILMNQLCELFSLICLLLFLLNTMNSRYMTTLR
jgi:hypothetical protein